MIRELEAAIDRKSPTEADTLLANVSLPLRSIFFPLGFPVEIFTNSEAVLEAALQSWGSFHQRFDYPAANPSPWCKNWLRRICHPSTCSGLPNSATPDVAYRRLR